MVLGVKHKRQRFQLASIKVSKSLGVFPDRSLSISCESSGMDFFKIFAVSKFFVFIFKGDGANAKNLNGLSGDRSYRSRGTRFEF